MPVARYFMFVGGALLALLFLIDAYVPSQALVASHAAPSIDRNVVRIRSDAKLPERVVYDTSLPTIVPPPAPLIFAVQRLPQSVVQAEAPTQAFAMAIKESPPAGAKRLKPVQKQPGKRKTTFASDETGFRFMAPAGW